MSTINTGNELGTKLCEIFGQPPDRVQAITITVEARAVATVQISRLVNVEEAQQICTLFEYYQLVKTGEHKQVHPQGFVADVPEPQDEWSVRAREALSKIEEVTDGS